MEEAKNNTNSITKYLSQKKNNDIWDAESAISRLVAERGVSLNFFNNNFVMDKLFQITFKKSIP